MKFHPCPISTHCACVVQCRNGYFELALSLHHRQLGVQAGAPVRNRLNEDLADVLASTLVRHRMHMATQPPAVSKAVHNLCLHCLDHRMGLEPIAGQPPTWQTLAEMGVRVTCVPLPPSALVLEQSVVKVLRWLGRCGVALRLPLVAQAGRFLADLPVPTPDSTASSMPLLSHSTVKQQPVADNILSGPLFAFRRVSADRRTRADSAYMSSGDEDKLPAADQEQPKTPIIEPPVQAS